MPGTFPRLFFILGVVLKELSWHVVDVIKAGGLTGIGDAKTSPYYEKSYQLGKKLAEDM